MLFPARLFAGALAAAPDSLPATVRGIVADSAGHPVPTASVALDSGGWHPVAQDGSFTIAGVSQAGISSSFARQASRSIPCTSRPSAVRRSR